MIHDPNSSCVLNVYFRPITLYSVAVRSDFCILVSTQLSLPFRIIAIGKLRNDVFAFENQIDYCFSIFLCLKIFKPLITLNRISYYFHVSAFFSKLIFAVYIFEVAIWVSQLTFFAFTLDEFMFSCRSISGSKGKYIVLL